MDRALRGAACTFQMCKFVQNSKKFVIYIFRVKGFQKTAEIPCPKPSSKDFAIFYLPGEFDKIEILTKL